MLMPKRVKRRRVHRGRMKGKALRGNTISNGEYGLMALAPSWITSNQIEAARIAMTRFIKRGGQVWIKIFPDKPVTKKPAKPVWAAERAHRSIGWRPSDQAEYYLKLRALPRRLQERP